MIKSYSFFKRLPVILLWLVLRFVKNQNLVIPGRARSREGKGTQVATPLGLARLVPVRFSSRRMLHLFLGSLPVPR